MQEKPEIVNNKEEIPWEHYKVQFEKIDPEETASRCHVEYDPSAGSFAIRLMGVEYRVSWPEFEVTTSHEGYAALRDTLQAKILTARFLTEGCYAPSEGKFVTYRDVPWGEHYFKPFQGRSDAPRILLWNQNRSLPRVNGAARRESPDHRRRRL